MKSFGTRLRSIYHPNEVLLGMKNYLGLYEQGRYRLPLIEPRFHTEFTGLRFGV